MIYKIGSFEHQLVVITIFVGKVNKILITILTLLITISHYKNI